MEEKIKGETASGFKFEIDKRLMNDYDFIEKVNNMAETGLGMPDLIKYMIGDEGYRALKEHCRRKDGFLSLKRMQHEMNDMMSVKIDDGVDLKNS